MCFINVEAGTIQVAGADLDHIARRAPDSADTHTKPPSVATIMAAFVAARFHLNPHGTGEATPTIPREKAPDLRYRSSGP